MSVTVTQRWLVALLAMASVGTTALVGINVFGRHRHPTADGGDDLRGGVLGPTSPENPPVLFTLPPFALIDHLGQTFGSQQLRGKTWIADFVFSRCAGPCPMMTQQMTQLQTQLAEHPAWKNIRLISVSVDPEHDTPSVLGQYADEAHADAGHWRFLTGAHSEIWRLIKTAFRLPIKEDPENRNMPIFHSQKFVLVDPLGRVRGFYDALEPQGRQDLMRDLDLVVLEMPHTVETESPTQPVAQERSWD